MIKQVIGSCFCWPVFGKEHLNVLKKPEKIKRLLGVAKVEDNAMGENPKNLFQKVFYNKYLPTTKRRTCYA